MWSSYPLRAESLDGTVLVPFTLADGPCLIDEDTFVLTSRKDSPLLRYSTVLLGSDIPDVFEGDYILADDVEYLVYYRRGFKAKDAKGRSVQLKSLGKFKVISNIYNRDEREKLVRDKYKYKYGDILFRFEQMYGLHNGKLLINYKGGMLLDLEKIQQSAGFKLDSVEAYFGDGGLRLFNGMPVYEDTQGQKTTLKGEKIL